MVGSSGSVHVEIWSDLACLWCYVGRRRFEAALAAFEHRDQVRVTWRSFELDPAAPPERGGERAQHLAAKYGVTRERAIEMQDQMAAAAAGDGIEMRFDLVRAGSTFDAHRLLPLAPAHPRPDAVKARLPPAPLTPGALGS